MGEATGRSSRHPPKCDSRGTRERRGTEEESRDSSSSAFVIALKVCWTRVGAVWTSSEGSMRQAETPRQGRTSIFSTMGAKWGSERIGGVSGEA